MNGRACVRDNIIFETTKFFSFLTFFNICRFLAWWAWWGWFFFGGGVGCGEGRGGSLTTKKYIVTTKKSNIFFIFL